MEYDELREKAVSHWNFSLFQTTKTSLTRKTILSFSSVRRFEEIRILMRLWILCKCLIPHHIFNLFNEFTTLGISISDISISPFCDWCISLIVSLSFTHISEFPSFIKLNDILSYVYNTFFLYSSFQWWTPELLPPFGCCK